MTALAQPKASDGRFAPPYDDQDLFDRVAVAWQPSGDDVHANFLSACEADAKAHAGVVSVNRVRAMLETVGIPPRRFSAMWSHYTGEGRPMRRLPRWEECRGSASRNNGKPYPIRKWVG